MEVLNAPAQNLKGITLKDGWQVIKRISYSPQIMGGYFSVSYIVEKNGEIAFLKALDFSLALKDPNPTKALLSISENYEFEKELLELCADKKLSKIIKIIAHDNIPPLPGEVIPVPYFILEYADGDLKSQIDFDSRLNTAWLLKILHNVTVGLYQLHQQGVAIKKLKPEDIKSFGSDLYKLSELGYAGKKGVNLTNYFAKEIIDVSSTTIDGLYGYTDPDWIFNSQAADAYHLGSLVLFLFTQVNMTTCMSFFIDEQHHWANWTGPYSDVLPYLLVAFDEAVQFIYTSVDDAEIRTKLIEVISQLCHPDPHKRGHPKTISSKDSSLSLYRYINIFDRLSKLSTNNL